MIKDQKTTFIFQSIFQTCLLNMKIIPLKHELLWSSNLIKFLLLLSILRFTIFVFFLKTNYSKVNDTWRLNPFHYVTIFYKSIQCCKRLSFWRQFLFSEFWSWTRNNFLKMKPSIGNNTKYIFGIDIVLLSCCPCK